MSTSTTTTTAAAAAWLLLWTAATVGGVWGAVVPLEGDQCAVGYVHCFNGEGCVLKEQVCDGSQDCADGTDEYQCDLKEVADFELPPEVLPLEALERRESLEEQSMAVAPEAAAGEAAAGEAAAEAEAEAEAEACAPGEHQCLDGTCISKERICDGPRDCFDGSDEDVHAGCAGNLSDAEWVNDAPRHESVTLMTLRVRNCTEEEFRCADGYCIAANKTCDEHEDCPDGSDELLACPTDLPCHDGFRCGNRRCIPLEWVCDGSADCTDTSDEDALMCSTWVLPPPPHHPQAPHSGESLQGTSSDPCLGMAPLERTRCWENHLQQLKVQELHLRQRVAREQLEVVEQGAAMAKELALEQLRTAEVQRRVAEDHLQQQQRIFALKEQALEQSSNKLEVPGQ